MQDSRRGVGPLRAKAMNVAEAVDGVDGREMIGILGLGLRSAPRMRTRRSEGSFTISMGRDRNLGL